MGTATDTMPCGTRCARCKWSAEQEGYDDDSQPLPTFKAKYAEFTALMKEGRTAEWQPGRR